MSVITILKTIASASASVYNLIKDKTTYSTSTDELINLAIEFYNKGDNNTSLTMLEAIAKDIDCDDFHNFHIFQYRNHDARRKYNEICLYIAKIYFNRGNYSQVVKWADKLAYYPHISIDEWESLLTSSDYNDLMDKFGNHDNWNDSASESLNDYLTRPCD